MISETVVKTFDELLRLRPVAASATDWFEAQSHNNDLCPAFERKANRVFDAFGRFRRVAYDIQGIRDRGIDVAVRWDDGAQYLIGLQIKGVWDLDQKDYLSKLKAQTFEALNDHGPLLQAYYILLCVPSNRLFRDRIRSIKAEFKTVQRTMVVDPTNSLAFLRHGSVRIDVVVENLMRQGDPVGDAARASIAMLPPTQAALVLWMASLFLQTDSAEPRFDEIIRSEFIERVYAASPDIERSFFFDREEELDDEIVDRRDTATDRKRDIAEQVSEDLDALLEQFVELRGEDRYRAIHDSVSAVIALQYDSYVRLGIRRDDVAEYLFHLLGFPDRFEISLEPGFDANDGG